MFGSYLNLVMSLLCLDVFVFSQQNEKKNLTATANNLPQIVRQRLLEDALLPCNSSNGTDLELIEWWYKRIGGVYIGAFNATSRHVHTNWTKDGAYQIADNGSLIIHNVRRELVERYECLSKFLNGNQTRNSILLRLDFSFWYAPEPFSLFYGSCIFALIFCVASFLLNIFWILIRWSVLSWIKRTERLSRVRAMLVAMEKYRQKHMESLHEGYNRRMSTFRENYHNQVETIRNSYLESSERFRDYRQAQKENVQQHLDGYYQQISRLREFGHKRVEHLWESYEKSVNAVRTFTLEQRLKILNQYKVKQRYVNKLLEAIGTETNVDIISRKEAAIREVLGEEQPPPTFWSSSHHPSNNSNLRRSASFHSLPEFPLVDEILEEEEQQIIYVNLTEFNKNNQEEIEKEEKEYLLALQQPSTSTASSILPLFNNNKIQA
uniref:Ig-like domain-containing protein n=1 Tax=Meloidogyne incognita TaxID=6306 RepID=A0A914M3B1_MELIC